MADRVSSEVLEERIGAIGERAASIDGKIDTLVQGFSDFKVEHARQMGQIETTLGGLGTEVRNHVAEDERRFEEHGREMRDRHNSQKKEIGGLRKLLERGANGGGISPRQAGAAVGGAGVAGALFDRVLTWLFGMGPS